MRDFKKNLLDALNSFLEIFDNLCKVNPKIYEDKIQQEVNQQRNKAVIIFHSAVILYVFIQLVTKRCSVSTGLISIFVCSTINIMLFVCCYNHSGVFKILHNIIMGVSGPILMLSGVEGGHRAWIGAQMYPTLILFCSGSLYHFILQAGFQLFFLNTLYQPYMLGYIDYTPSREFLRSLTLNSTTLGFLNIVIIVCIDGSLRKAYQRVQVAEQKKDEFEKQKIFLLSFSHELRNIINSLMGNVSLASLEHLPERAKIFLRNADICAESLLHLINNILDSGKVEIGDLEINPVTINMYSTMEKIWSICCELIRRKNLHGCLRISKNVPEFLIIDHYRLTQIFLNLVGNAIKFTERGSINIFVEWISNADQVTQDNFEPCPFPEENELDEGVFEKNQQLFILDNKNFFTLNPLSCKINSNSSSTRNEGNKGILKVSVTDTGNGIAKEDMPKLFHKFSQISSDPSKRKLGTGLGLFISKELCERMGGEIRVFSTEGKGSCFMFCIPLTPASPNSIARTDKIQDNSQSQSKLRALVVDDESFSRNILENFFAKLGVEVVSTAQNGLEAYEKYTEYIKKGEPIEIVTMDLTMPVMDGKKAAEKIRKFEEEKEIDKCLLIVISANISESEIAECIDKNGRIKADAFLKKPARIEEISRAISCYLKTSKKYENEQFSYK